jgi:hypothetical protein
MTLKAITRCCILTASFFVLTATNLFAEDGATILSVQREMTGDIPQFVELLANARKRGDPKLCDVLPTPQHQTFDQGDYSIDAPRRGQWVGYCQALALNDAVLCHKIDRMSHPNLKQECEKFFEKSLITSPKSCYDQIGVLFEHPDDVRNCFLKYKDQMEEAPAIYRQIESCLILSHGTTSVDFQNEAKCVFELAQDSKDRKLCLLLRNPYGNQKYSRPDCLELLKNVK